MVFIFIVGLLLAEGFCANESFGLPKNYVGCFKDSREERILDGLRQPYVASSMTIELCMNHCTEHGFNFAGLQFRSECFCGNKIRTGVQQRNGNQDTQDCCTLSCSGRRNETCGGDLCSSIFSVNVTGKMSFPLFNNVLATSVSTVCQTNPCAHGGTCLLNSSPLINGSYICQCPLGYIGSHCEHPDPCRFPNVCLGGSCISFPENGSFACQCLPDSCSSENAICDTSKITMLTCKCPTNQYGPQCQYTCPCQNGGRCIMQNDNTTIICSCDESRFYGDRCEFLSPCASQPCYMGGTCVRNATKFLCQCPPNRIGSQCEKSDPCQSNPCLGNSTCYRLNDYNYKCVCDQIHTGKNCQEIVPTTGLYGSFHSACVRPTDCDIELGLICFPERRCACMEGFTWTIDKESPIAAGRCEPVNSCLQNPCLNRGRCEQLNGTNEYVCHCRSGFGGKTCQLQTRDRSNQCYSGFCLNGGSCFINNNGQMECRCLPGYMGRYCDVMVGPCYSNPCPHPDSLCLSVQEGYVCLCNDNQYLEPYCNTSKYCPGSICNGRGICFNTIDHNSYCRCLEPYAGSRCTLIDTCATEQKCHPSATCVPRETGSYCICPPDRTGPTCHEEFWLDPCMTTFTTCFHHGTCMSSPELSTASPTQPYRCACTEAYTGARCELELACPSQRCLNNGTCQRSTQFGYFECVCMSGYTGSSCELAIPMLPPPSPCLAMPCLNGGKCLEISQGGFSCSCLPNFSGQRCEDLLTTTMSPIFSLLTIITTRPTVMTSHPINQKSDVCKDNPCLNAGSCVPNGVGGFVCQCLNGFVGQRCEARVDAESFMSSGFSLINLAWIIPIAVLFLVVITILIGFICCRKSTEPSKEPCVYMSEQRPFPATGITGNTKYREYCNPGFVMSSNMVRE